MKEMTYKPVTYYFSGSAGATHTVNPSTGIHVKNTGTGDLTITINGMAMVVKQNEYIDMDFVPFTSIVTAGTTIAYRLWVRG